MVFLLARRRCELEGGHKSHSVMLVMLVVWWSVSLVRVKIPNTSLVLSRQVVLATRTGWDSIWGIRIAYYARRVVNSGEEFVLRAGGPLRLMQ